MRAIIIRNATRLLYYRAPRNLRRACDAVITSGIGIIYASPTFFLFFFSSFEHAKTTAGGARVKYAARRP